MFLFKVVLGKSVAEVAQNVVKHVRLALLTPEELKQVEQENEKDRVIPVGAREKITLLIKRFCRILEIFRYIYRSNENRSNTTETGFYNLCTQIFKNNLYVRKAC